MVRALSVLLACVLVIFVICIIVNAVRGPRVSASSSAEEENTDDAEIVEETEAPAEPVSITISFAGDCTLGTDEAFDYESSLNAYYEQYGSSYFLENVRSIFEADDLTVVNFEGTLTNSDDRCENLYAFKGDPSFASILSSSSVEAANLANNHSQDYGDQGYQDTMNNLSSAGIVTFGYDDTAIVDVKGVKVGLVGIYELYDHLERTQQLKDNIAKVKEEGAQLVAVVFHWGNENETTPDSNEVTLGHLAIDEGADIVVGGHPHVIQPIEEYNGRYIVYSLANFCFGGNSAPSDMETFIFQQTFTVTGDDVALDQNINVIPCIVSSADGYNNYQPTPAEGEEAENILSRVYAPIE